MKQCPVCNAVCFDDMETCYGCLHKFGREGAPDRVLQQPALTALNGPASTEGREEAGLFADGELDDAKDDETPRSVRVPKVLPKLTIESVDEGNPKSSSSCETWSFKLSIPADCEGVTLRLERH